MAELLNAADLARRCDKKLGKLHAALESRGYPTNGWSVQTARTGNRLRYVMSHPVHGRHHNGMPGLFRKLEGNHVAQRRRRQRVQTDDEDDDEVNGPVNDPVNNNEKKYAEVEADNDEVELVADRGGKLEPCRICWTEDETVRALSGACPQRHAFCGQCLASWLTKGDVEAVMDKEHGLPHCPTCKETGVGHVSPNDIQRLKNEGTIDAAAQERLEREMVRMHMPVYTCCKPECKGICALEPGPSTNDDAYVAKCPECNLEQCFKCRVAWKTHKGMTCTEFMARGAPMDAATLQLTKYAVPCPGGCGMGLMRSSGCNIVSCVKCKIFVCALCGDKLDSSSWGTRHHNSANTHYWDAAKNPRCHQAMFMSHEVWLARQKNK